MTPIMWAIVLLVGALAFLALELFIPSAGLLSVLSVACVVGSVGLIYYHHGFTAGSTYLVILAVLFPVVISSGIKHWPYTPIGRRILNVDPEGYDETVENPHADLIHKQGRAITKMLPSGSVRIEGSVYDAVSDGQAIEVDQPVEVVDVDGNRIRVRPIAALTESPLPAHDPLSRPASEVIGDAFEDPLT